MRNSKIKTIADLKYYNEKAGYCFFSKETRQFHKSKTIYPLYDSLRFITEDIMPDDSKCYKVWQGYEDGKIIKVADYATLDEARKAANSPQNKKSPSR